MSTKNELLVNNLSSSEITLFYNFLNIYETTFKKCLSNKNIKSYETEFNEYIKKNSIKLNKKTLVEIPKGIPTSNNDFYFTKQKSVLLSFVTHLRNSIAHCQIIKKGESFNLKDFTSNGITLSMVGNIEAKHLNELIHIFIKSSKN